MLIFNRWGNLIYEGDGTPRWDGTYNGKPCPESAYVYVITAFPLLGQSFTRVGTVTLLR
jgi:gliding motility-associated-like protein